MKAFFKCLLVLFVLSVTILPACKKEITPTKDESANLTDKAIYAKPAHRIIVHAGSLIVVPKGLGTLILGADKTTVENNIVTGNNFAGVTVFSTLVLGALAGIPRRHLRISIQTRTIQ